MKKLLIIFLCGILLISCNKNEENLDYTTELFENKVEYVGNNSEVGGLLNLQATPKGKFQILSEEEPFGLIVETDYGLEEEKIKQEGYELLGLIENLSYVTYKNKEEEKTITLEEAEEDLGYSPKEFYKDKGKLEEFEKGIN